MSATRQQCTGGSFDHEPTHMSLARVLDDDSVLFRCPLCLSEALLNN